MKTLVAEQYDEVLTATDPGTNAPVGTAEENTGNRNKPTADSSNDDQTEQKTASASSNSAEAKTEEPKTPEVKKKRSLSLAATPRKIEPEQVADEISSEKFEEYFKLNIALFGKLTRAIPRYSKVRSERNHCLKNGRESHIVNSSAIT